MKTFFYILAGGIGGAVGGLIFSGGVLNEKVLFGALCGFAGVSIAASQRAGQKPPK
jgi:predicted MFS family arabinose efflux permease